MFEDVSAIVSTYSKDRMGYVLDCVESLEKQSMPPREIILVLDPDQDLIEAYKTSVSSGVRIVVSEERGLSNARNAGIRDAKTEIVAFIDDDAVADEAWLENLVRNYDDPNVVGVGGLIKAEWENNRPMWFPEELDWIVGCSYKGLPERTTIVRNPIGCNMSFRKVVFEQAGYFAADIGRFGRKLIGSEEMELSTRIPGKIPNSKIVYDPSAVVHHRISRNRANLTYLWRRSFYEGVSKSLIVGSKQYSSTVLTVEDQYLRYLFKVSVPSRLRRIYSFKSLCQLLVLFLSSCAVFAGFLPGRLAKV